MGIRNGKSVLLTRRSVLQAALVANTVLVARPWPAYASTSQGPVAETIYGKVRGSRVGEIHIFKGIPYGASTAGGNRFRPPQKPQAWRGVRDALHFGHVAPQDPYESSCDPQMRRLQERSVPDELPPQGEDCPRAQCLDTSPCRRRQATCHGDVSWRRVRRGQGQLTRNGWDPPCAPAQCGGCLVQPSTRRVWPALPGRQR